MSSNLDLWKLLAGLGILLFGMLLIEESVKALSGRAFRRIIRRHRPGPGLQYHFNNRNRRTGFSGILRLCRGIPELPDPLREDSNESCNPPLGNAQWTDRF